jgi:hypothetical protein
MYTEYGIDYGLAHTFSGFIHFQYEPTVTWTEPTYMDYIL